MTFSLAAARAVATLSEHDARQRLGSGAEQDDDAEYQGLRHLVELRNDAVLPAWVYLRDGRVRLVYASDDALEGLTTDQLEAELSGAPEILASRAAKAAALYVHPGDGVAYSADDERVHFVEVFPPCTLAEYRDEVYIEPGPWIR